MLCNSYIVCNKINLVLKYPFNALKNHFIFCHYFPDNPGQNYVDTSSRKAFLHINRTPVPSNNVDAVIFIFTCLHNILQHNIVKGGRGIKQRTVKFTFLFKKLVKSYCPHSFWPGLFVVAHSCNKDCKLLALPCFERCNNLEKN